jgi:hypothetical protein
MKTVPTQTGNLQTNRVGADVNGGENRHAMVIKCAVVLL